MENTGVQKEDCNVQEVGAVRIYQVAWRTGRHVLQSSEPTLSVLHPRPSCSRPHKLDYTFSDYDTISLWNISPHILFDFSLLLCICTCIARYMLAMDSHNIEVSATHSSRSTAAWLSCPRQTTWSQSQSWFPKLLYKTIYTYSLEKIESPLRTVELVNEPALEATQIRKVMFSA